MEKRFDTDRDRTAPQVKGLEKACGLPIVSNEKLFASFGIERIW